MSAGTIVALIALGQASALSVGGYVCSVEQYAGIGSVHLEGSGPPAAFTEGTPYRFRLVVSVGAEAGQLRIVETPYTGPDRSTYQWQDANSTLHAPYVGDGRVFSAEGEPGFLIVGPDRGHPGSLQFYHSGFQYAGGEDESVAVRWGRCSPES